MTNTGTARQISLVCRSEAIADYVVSQSGCVASHKFGKVTFLPEPIDFPRVAAFARSLVIADHAIGCQS